MPREHYLARVVPAEPMSRKINLRGRAWSIICLSEAHRGRYRAGYVEDARKRAPKRRQCSREKNWNFLSAAVFAVLERYDCVTGGNACSTRSVETIRHLCARLDGEVDERRWLLTMLTDQRVRPP